MELLKGELLGREYVISDSQALNCGLRLFPDFVPQSRAAAPSDNSSFHRNVRLWSGALDMTLLQVSCEEW